MVPTEIDTDEFTFFPPGLDDGDVEHRAVLKGAVDFYVVHIFRINSKKSVRISVEIPRTIAQAKRYDSASNVVRDAIGLAMRDNLFNNPPNDIVYLDVDVPRWTGNLSEAIK